MLALGDKIIAGSFKSGASWEVGDVGISALGIDEALNKRRYLNGQVISQAQFVEFTAFLKSRVSVYPSLATTEVNWQAAVTNSDLGQCGQFVIDDDAGTIRLPKVVNIQGLIDLTGLGTTVEAGLPNITGDVVPYNLVGLCRDDGIYSGAFKKGNVNVGATLQNIAANSSSLGFDASLSNSIYGNSTTVQPEAVQYPYFIQVAEGVETSVDVSREIELNNPFSLLDYKYSEYELSNASWLLSNGQWNSGAVYQSVYNLLLQIYNGTVTKAGVSVKLSTETYTDTDFVLNTGDTTFRLPTKVALASGNKVAGNGMTLGLTDGTTNTGLEINSVAGDAGVLYNRTANYGETLPHANIGGAKLTTGLIGITTDETKSGIETSANGLYLYFYVGETVQDANLINAGQMSTLVSQLTECRVVVETYVNGTSWYRVYSDGWCEQGGLFPSVSSDQDITITLVKPFKDTNYAVNTLRGNTNYNTNVTWYWLGYFNKTNFNFTTRARSAGNGVDGWQACGYIS